MSSSSSGSTVTLPEVFAIGFTGPRQLADEAMCLEAIRRLLVEQNAIPNRAVYGVTSVAAGGDLLFAETCVEQHIPLVVLLPFAVEELEKDFDAPGWARAQQVISTALLVEIIGTAQARTESYYECDLQTVKHSEMLIALWNGKPAQDLGDTQQIKDFAIDLGRPVSWIHSETGMTEIIPEKNVRKLSANSELTFLNQLPSAGTSPADDSLFAIAHAWQRKLNANAVAVAPQVRRLAAVPIICTALAAFVSGAASHVHSNGLWAAAGAILGLAAGLLPLALKLGKRQALWVRIRTAAEISRSFEAMWDTPIRYQIVGPEILPELSGMILSLNYLKVKARQTSNKDVADFKQQYLKDRLLNQKDYFLAQSLQAAKKGRRYSLAGKICSISAIILSVWMFGSKSLIKTSSAAAGGSWLPLLTSALFQIATIAGALLVVHDCNRRQNRYQELHNALADWEVELRAFHTWSTVIQVVSKIERALLVELLEWRALLQNMKMPRN